MNLDAGYDLAVAQDSGATGGFSPTNTTADGVIIFMNVEPGPVGFTITPPDGYSLCNLFAYDSGPNTYDFPVEVSAGSVTRVTVTCFED